MLASGGSNEELEISEERKQRIIDTVKNQTQKYEKNKGHRISWTKKTGKNQIHAVSFMGEDEKHRTHYVYETSTIVASFDKLDNLIKAAELRTNIFDMHPNTLKTISLSVIALFSVLTVCILAIMNLDSKALDAMVAFAGLTIGYLAGKPA